MLPFVLHIRIQDHLHIGGPPLTASERQEINCIKMTITQINRFNEYRVSYCKTDKPAYHIIVFDKVYLSIPTSFSHSTQGK